MASDNIPFAQKFARLKAEYAAQLPAKLAVILNDWNALKAQHASETIAQLHRNVHSLIGTSGTFGFTSLSKSARDLEHSLKPLIVNSTQNFMLNTELTQDITQQINHLLNILDSIQQDLDKEAADK
ncbi:MAG TPA: Hpt domain-containing protein [Cellvibrio sp.]|nr:Hpt domain-containing protein [Cellvibrio sp.]